MAQPPVLKFMTNSTDLKQRQVKGFAASLGTQGEKYGSFDELLEDLSHQRSGVVLLDHKHVLSELEWVTLKKIGLDVFLMQQMSTKEIQAIGVLMVEHPLKYMAFFFNTEPVCGELLDVSVSPVLRMALKVYLNRYKNVTLDYFWLWSGTVFKCWSGWEPFCQDEESFFNESRVCARDLIQKSRKFFIHLNVVLKDAHFEYGQIKQGFDGINCATIAHIRSVSRDSVTHYAHIRELVVRMMHLSVCEHLCDFGVGYICRFLPKDTNGCVQCELSCLVALVKPIDPLQNGAWFILEGDMV